jgi:hypothetical protein
MELIDQVPAALADYEWDGNTRARNRMLRMVRRVLLECSCSSEFGVVVATIVVESPVFSSIRGRMRGYDLWDDGLEQGYREACRVACPKRSNPMVSNQRLL